MKLELFYNETQRLPEWTVDCSRSTFVPHISAPSLSCRTVQVTLQLMGSLSVHHGVEPLVEHMTIFFKHVRSDHYGSVQLSFVLSNIV
jgi:hypothetical protein